MAAAAAFSACDVYAAAAFVLRAAAVVFLLASALNVARALLFIALFCLFFFRRPIISRPIDVPSLVAPMKVRHF